MDKKFLIFITSSELRVYDVERKEYIGINDSTSFKYCGNTDIENFCACIADQLGEEKFADLAATVTIVNCGANLSYVDKLHNVLEGCKEKNVLNVERILPLIAFNNGLKKNEEMTYEVINQCYLLRRNDANGINCSLKVENDGAKELLPADFEFLFDFVGVNHWDEEKEKSLAEYKLKYENLEEKYERLKNDYEKSRIDNDNPQKKELVEKMVTSLKNKITPQPEYTDKRMKFKQIKSFEIGKEVTLVSMKTDDFNSFIVEFCVSNGDTVAKDDCVAKFYKPNNLDLAEAVLLAPFVGRFYSVLKDDCCEGDIVRYDSHSNFYYPLLDIGIFANLNCSEEDAYRACNFDLY